MFPMPVWYQATKNPLSSARPTSWSASSTTRASSRRCCVSERDAHHLEAVGDGPGVVDLTTERDAALERRVALLGIEPELHVAPCVQRAGGRPTRRRRAPPSRALPGTRSMWCRSRAPYSATCAAPQRARARTIDGGPSCSSARVNQRCTHSQDDRRSSKNSARAVVSRSMSSCVAVDFGPLQRSIEVVALHFEHRQPRRSLAGHDRRARRPRPGEEERQVPVTYAVAFARLEESFPRVLPEGLEQS